MRLGLQAKPTPPSAVFGANRNYADISTRGVYAYSEIFTVAAADSSGSIYLGAAPFAGSAIAVAVEASQARTGGSVDIDMVVAGSTVLTATIDDTNTTKHVVTEVPGTHAVAANDSLRIDVTATSFGPVSTDMRIQVFFTNEAIPTSLRKPAYLRAEVDPTTSPTVNNNAPIVFDQIAEQVGDDIFLDVTDGGFILKGGSTYIVFANILSRFNAVWQLYDKTGAAVVAGTQATTWNSDSGNGIDGVGGGGMSAPVSPVSDTEYEVRNVSGGAVNIDNTNGANTCLAIVRIA